MIDIKSFDIIDNLKSDILLLRLLENNMRCEYLYNKCIVSMKINQSHEFNAFSRLLWESNYQMRNPSDNSYFDEDGSTFNIRLTLGECVDYIWKCAPPIYQKQIPNIVKNVEDLCSLMKTFLFENARKEMYHEFFKEITQYDKYNKPVSFDSVGVDTLAGYSKDDKNICYVISADKDIMNIDNDTIIEGIFMIRILNRKHLKEFNNTINSNEYVLCDYESKSIGGYYITIKAKTNKLNKMINDSYTPIINR